MTAALTLPGWLIALPLALPLLVLAVELALGLIPRSKSGTDAAGPPPRAVILMPAHNECQSIAGTIAALAPAIAENMTLLVVADNCTDDTAAVSRAAGAEVIERTDPARRGKGHALAFGRDWLANDPPDCVIVLDADCMAEPGALERLARASTTLGRPVQGSNLLCPAPGDGPMVQISNFAFLIKNLIRQRGDARLGAPAILGGTGMAAPWRLFADAPLATSDLAEDLALGIHFARGGANPCFVEDARIRSAPASHADTLAQRTRWEHGFIGTARRHALPLIAEGIARMRPGLAWLALHLLVPPLALLVALGGAGLVLCGLLALAGASWLPALLIVLCLGAVMLLLVLNWAISGRDTISGATLARIPLYVAWKLPIYLRLIGRRQHEWVRTRRPGEE
ncbi:MAG: glycosyltransferase family 2 protein [Sphingomonas bacterium]